MTLEEVFEAWAEDSKIDQSSLGSESLKIPQLHHKWFRMFSEQRLVLRRYEAAMKALRNRKSLFFQHGPDDETRRAGWELPSRGKILKTEVGTYVDCDRDVVELGQKIAYQTEVVEAIQDIVKSINNRSFLIKNTLEWLRFTNGG